MQEQKKVKISERAAIARIRRKLKHKGEVLKSYNGQRWQSNLGNWYIVDVNANTVIAKHCTVAGLAGELGVLKPWEEIEA